jgi:formylglycine-generating enzyme required for sulfatase activity
MKLHLHFTHKSGLLAILGLLFFSQAIHAQDRDIYGNKVSSELCDQMEFDTDEEVQRLVTKLLEVYNLHNRYIIGPCSRVSNCVATRDERGRPYILYNPAFLDKIKVFSFTETDLPTAAEDWAVLLVLAHEIGHHLNNHIINPHPDLTKRDMELEADETAGYLLYLLNAPDLKTAQKGLQVPQISEAGSYTHPPRSERLAAFRNGWEKAAKKFPRAGTGGAVSNGGGGDSTPVQPPATTAAVMTDPLVGKFIRVKGGTFTMGCTGEQGSDCDDDEKPAHPVTLGDYYIGETEVTQAQWRAVMGNNPSSFTDCDECPVEKVSWNDVQDFISKLNSRSGGARYRLPTEAEWEYAARGGSLSKGYKYAGSNSLDEVAWYDDNSGFKTHTVRMKKSNELGLYDMSGNVWEWCSDWEGSYSPGSQTNPTGPNTGDYRVYRGGGWLNYAGRCRVSARFHDEPDYRGNNLGFRLASSVPR